MRAAPAACPRRPRAAAHASTPRTGRGAGIRSCPHDLPSGLISRLKACPSRIQALLKRATKCSGRSFRHGRWDEHHERASLVRRTGAAAVGRRGAEPRRRHEPSARPGLTGPPQSWSACATAVSTGPTPAWERPQRSPRRCLCSASCWPCDPTVQATETHEALSRARKEHAMQTTVGS